MRYFTIGVTNLRAVAERIEAAGIPITEPPTEFAPVPGMGWLSFTDPDGNSIELLGTLQRPRLADGAHGSHQRRLGRHVDSADDPALHDPVDDATLARCFEAATWTPSGANAQEWRFVVLRSAAQRSVVADAAGPGGSQQARSRQPRHVRMTRPRRGVHVDPVRAEAASDGVGHAARRVDRPRDAELPAGGARSRLGACLTSWASYGGEELLRTAVGVPDDWIIPGHIVVGWPNGRHGPVRRRPWRYAVYMDTWGAG